MEGDNNRIPKEKVCKKCGRTLPIENFRKYKKSYTWSAKCNNCSVKGEIKVETGKFLREWRESHKHLSHLWNH